MTQSRFISALVLFILTAVGVVLLPGTAQAHNAGSFFLHHWPANGTVSYGVHIGFPGTDYRHRALDGKNQWNNAANSGEPDIFWSLADDVNYGRADLPCGVPGFGTGALFWNNLDPVSTGLIGVTRLCGQAPVVNFTIEFDSTRVWYAGTGDAPGSSTDFWSVATHEFGHVVGFTGNNGGHYNSNDSICANNSSQATMCPSYVPGTERIRTVSPHDIHTFDAAY
jgi:hypothetical protein